MFRLKSIARLLLIFSIPVVVLLLSNCRKEQFGNGSISFSNDTLTFDTVFSSLGSTTRYFKVFNTDKKAVKISNIQLKHLTGTQFRIQVDGVNGDLFNDIEIPGKDSIYVFVEVTVNPNSTATPFVIIDDVSFLVNGEESIVHLQAFGQNAHFHYGEEITSSVIWNNDLPHVVISHDTVPGVYVRCSGSLTIQPGCKVFFANNSALFVEGTLKAEAFNWSDSITFEGVRLESFYIDRPGQWFGIVFLRNTDCTPAGSFNHCVINESSYGIYAGAGLSTNIADYQGTILRPEVTIKNTIVKNCSDNAVYGFNAKITAENSIFYAAGDNLLKFGLGGDYSFTHCTIFNAGSKSVDHKNETLLLSNFVADGNQTVYPEKLKAWFTNCVVYGSLQNEISFNNYMEPPTNLSEFEVTFNYCQVKAKQDTFEMFTQIHNNILFNTDPRFRSIEEGNFTPWDSTGFLSPLIDYSPLNTAVGPDIYGTTRPQRTQYDAGAIEVQ